MGVLYKNVFIIFGFVWNFVTGLSSLLGYFKIDTQFMIMIFDNLTSKELAEYTLLVIAIISFIFSVGFAVVLARGMNNAKDFDGRNDATNVLRDIGISHSDNQCALWSFEGVKYQCAHTNNTWEEWLKDIIKSLGPSDELDFFNYGDKHYFLDLVTNKNVKIPVGVKAKSRKVGADIKNGMVLMFRDYAKK